jgi:hypothetical protein
MDEIEHGFYHSRVVRLAQGMFLGARRVEGRVGAGEDSQGHQPVRSANSEKNKFLFPYLYLIFLFFKIKNYLLSL